ncbi:A24 family peptidase [Cupriavidus pauculus]|jgi:prepilin peptidase CpaA|uniref:A24 family peptidase n=1 Tax=Cupriavidus pauculus TaxID=82633 RepID=UPI0030FACA5A
MHVTNISSVFDPLTSASLMAVLGMAVVTDVSSHRIPNRLVAAGTVAALVLQVWQHGSGDGTWRWATGLAAAFVPFLLLYIVRAVGAGDAKLMGFVGAQVGPNAVPEILLATLLAGGVLGLIVMLWGRESGRTLHAVIGALLWLPFAGHASSMTEACATTEGQGSSTASTGANRIRTITRLPYAVAITTGVALVMTGVI